MKKGLLLINLGTPDNADKKSVRRYLREFLADSRVIDIPAFFRYCLLYLIILPFRTPKVTKAYQSIWTKKGSPLRYHSQELRSKLQAVLKDQYQVEFGMRYGNPSTASALAKLKNCDEITILPLYPQYSSAATGSALEDALQQVAKLNVTPNIKVIRDFYLNPAFIEAQANIIAPSVDTSDFILFSYHGLPENHLYKSGCKEICKKCPSAINGDAANVCYRAQCYTTTKLIAEKLGLEPQKYLTSFQSRLGKTPWIKPYTDEIMQDLSQRGIKNLTVVCPSFTTDCLETLEEIAIRANEDWKAMTGKQLITLPCLNSNPDMIKLIQAIIKNS